MATDDSVSKVPGEGDYPVTIGRYPSTAVARIDASLLLGAGIDADVQGEFGGDALSYYGTAVRQITLVVPSRQRDQAIQILTEAAQSRPAARSEDWVCSECKEVNGREFDSCWSCGKPWNESDEEHVPEVPRHVLPAENAPKLELPPLDENPYAPPNVTSVVVDTGSENVDDMIRRIWRGVVLSFAFPPLLFVSAFIGVQTQLRISNGSVAASESQRKRLGFATLVSSSLAVIVAFLLIAFAGQFWY